MCFLQIFQLSLLFCERDDIRSLFFASKLAAGRQTAHVQLASVQAHLRPGEGLRPTLLYIVTVDRLNELQRPLQLQHVNDAAFCLWRHSDRAGQHWHAGE